ncbi:MAG: uracil-DNA glycosylase [Blastocatellia bacterium]
MPQEIIEALADLARQIEEQLKFYREIGIKDIGDSLPAARPLGVADRAAGLAAPPKANGELPIEAAVPPVTEAAPRAALMDDARREEIKPARQEAMPKNKDVPGQAGLFGDLLPPEPAAPAAQTLPIIQAQDPSLEAIREDIGECTRCKLHEQRTHIVFGEGDPQARLVFIGEGPGADEDASGRPFVGRAGQLLDKIIAAIGLKRDECYIANVVKCRPPGNRTPERDETATCEQFLFRQLALIQPQVIVALGSPAFQCLLRTKDTITRSRGEWREWNGIKVMPTFHPAYLLRSPDKKREAWDDMKKVRDYLNSLAD